MYPECRVGREEEGEGEGREKEGQPALTILSDIDGVVADIVTATLVVLHGLLDVACSRDDIKSRDIPAEVCRRHPHLSWDTVTQVCTSAWNNPRFLADVPVLTPAWAVLVNARKAGIPVRFVTSRPPSRGVIEETRTWLEMYGLIDAPDEVYFEAAKWKVARRIEGHVLFVDDDPGVCRRTLLELGERVTVLVLRQPWNEGALVAGPLNYGDARLLAALAGMR